MLKWPRNAFMADFKGFYFKLNNLDGNHRDGDNNFCICGRASGSKKGVQVLEKHLVSLFRMGSDHGYSV